MCIDRRLPATEVDDAASDSDGDEGDGEGDDRQQNNRNDGLLAIDNLMRAIFPCVKYCHTIIVPMYS